MKASEVEQVYSVLKEAGVGISFNRAYLELVAKCNLMDLVYTETFSSVFLRYRMEDSDIFEEWLSGQPVEAAKALRSKYSKDAVFGFQKRSTGEVLDWHYEGKTFEMCVKPPLGEGKAESLSEEDIRGAVELLSEEWWNEERACSFVQTAREIDGSRFKLVKKDSQVVGIGQISISDGIGWIASVYVAEDFRGQGIGSCVVESLSEEAANEGCGKICLGAEEGSGVPEFYRSLGFETTDFMVYEFTP